MKLCLITALTLTLLSTTMTAAEKPKPADLIFVNGNVYPGAGLARAQAIAVSGKRIVAVGNTTEVFKYKGKDTKTVDLGGGFVMPGFNDAHLHLASGGQEKLQVNLLGSKSLQEMQQRITAKAKSSAAGEWLVGGGWDHTKWAAQTLPTRQDLDAVTGEHPAMFSRVDGHIAIANTAALKAAGITNATVPPHGSAIDHDSKGGLTGILREDGAMGLVFAKVPKPTPAKRREAIELALREAAEWGITSVQDNSDWEDFLVYEELEHEGKLTARISEWLRFDDPVELLRTHRAQHPATDTMLHTTTLKGFMDGSLGSRTAALLAEYSDEPGNRGLPRYEGDELEKKSRERAAAGFQMGFHAIGDRAAAMALDAFAAAERQVRESSAPNAKHDFRYRIEHCQVIAPDQFKQFHNLGVIASVQPNHLLTDMNWAEARIGAERARTSYPWKQFLDAGVPLAFGTDYPVEPITPFRGLYAAVTRKNEEGTKAYYTEQALSIEQALAAYTTGSAYAEFTEKDKGTLEPGKLADFVVLDRDLTKIKPQEILATKVLRTVVGGKLVYEISKESI